MKRLCLLALSMLLALNASAQGLEHQTTAASAPAVYFTRDISAEGLMKAYRALGQRVEGKVGIKISFGGPDEPLLDPKLLTRLSKETGGTLIDSNGLAGNRWTSAMNYALAEAHGYSAVAPVLMLDEDGDIDMPVKGGYHLSFARTGKHFDEFDTLIAVHRFKLHYIEALGGNIKNITLCLASKSGKSLIHSGGTDPNRYHNTAPDVLAASFADAAKAATDYKQNWAFVNVVAGLGPADRCRGADNYGDIGIVASLDVVALDQCSLDLALSRSRASDADKAAWLEYHQADVLEYAEKLGVGSRNYRLVNLD